MNYWRPPQPYRPKRSSLGRNVAIALAISVAILGLFYLALFVFLSFLGGMFKGTNK
jgi:hypothetical protein